uniref:Uncharacterized protein n=1 Tax=Pristionchus pacificus TaxID=54126 RepID=A0A2A6CEY6_PRIPA|eukprot:PDM76623.1 hypothetical protein PRIPAC_42989 [Pristionchus pacificus]
MHYSTRERVSRMRKATLDLTSKELVANRPIARRPSGGTNQKHDYFWPTVPARTVLQPNSSPRSRSPLLVVRVLRHSLDQRDEEAARVLLMREQAHPAMVQILILGPTGPAGGGAGASCNIRVSRFISLASSSLGGHMLAVSALVSGPSAGMSAAVAYSFMSRSNT